MFIDDARPVPLRAVSARGWTGTAVASIVLLLIGLQITADRAGFPGPLRKLLDDYVATPKSATVLWVGLGLASVGVSHRCRVWALSTAAALDVVVAGARVEHGGVLAFGTGPLLVLTGLAVMVWLRPADAERAIAQRGIAFGLLLIVASKIGDVWLSITAKFRPTVLDEYALLADRALAQPAWLFGRLVGAGGPFLHAVLHWVYIELPVAALVVAVYQLRDVRTGGWPRHFLLPTFLLLGVIGPVIYLIFPLVGPDVAFGSAGGVFRVGDYWPHVLPTTKLSPRPVAFDGFTPRNCMPSMHTAWALALFLHSRAAPRWLRAGGTFWLAGTVVATLGFGYHYGVDLVAGAVLCLTLESALRTPAQGRGWLRAGLVAFGTTFLTVLLLCCRCLATTMADNPLLFGLLIVGTTALFSAAFFGTYFIRPTAPPDRSYRYQRGAPIRHPEQPFRDPAAPLAQP